jgi:hypothetical protein
MVWFNDRVLSISAVSMHPSDREVLTDVGLAILTLETVATLVNRFLNYFVSFSESVDVSPNFDDCTRVLVTHNPRYGDPLIPAFILVGMGVATTETCRVYTNQHFTVVRRGNLTLLCLHGTRARLYDCLHG